MTERDPAVLDVLERTRPRSAEGADWDDVLRRAAPDRRVAPRRPVARAMRWAPGLVGGVALAAVFGVLVVRQGDAPPSAAPKGVTGVEALVHVTSIRDGQTDEQAAERMEAALAERARIQGITGFAIERSGTRLSVFVPRTRFTGWIRQWIPVTPPVRVVDARRSPLAEGVDPIAVALTAAREGGDPPLAYYIATRRSVPGGSSLDGPFATAAAARQRLRGSRPVAGAVQRVVAVPAMTSFTAQFLRRRQTFRADREGLVLPGEIAGMRARDDRLYLRVAESARGRLAADIASGAAPAVPALENASYAGWDASTGELAFTLTGAVSTAWRLAGPQVDALATVGAARSVGPVPPPRGARIAAPPWFISGSDGRPGLGVVPSTARRMVGVRTARGVWWVWLGVTADGGELAGVVAPGAGGGGGGCPVDPTHRLLTWCDGVWVQAALGRAAAGRIGDTVRRVVVVSRDGTRTEATVANGFYLAVIPTRIGHLRAIVAFDGSGEEVARLTAADPYYGPMFGSG